MKLFDTHTHLDFPMFDKDREKIISKFPLEGISKVVNVGCDKKSSIASIQLSEKYPFIYPSVGFHPHDAVNFDESFLKRIATNKNVVAIGEIGLDYFRNLSPKNVQKKVFFKQVEIAKKLDLPIILHNRDADNDCLEILKKFKDLKVVFHCFSSSLSFAKSVIELGFFISFTGNITFKNSRLFEVVEFVPLKKFFVETDSPYLSPRRGKRNSPLNLLLIVQKIAQIKKLSTKEIAKITYENSLTFFGIS